jgi:hypothetical protein
VTIDDYISLLYYVPFFSIVVTGQWSMHPSPPCLQKFPPQTPVNKFYVTLSSKTVEIFMSSNFKNTI